VVVAPEHVHRVLGESPEPFAPANLEKRRALAHFQPRGVLVSHGSERARRRSYNQTVLDTAIPWHQLGVPIVGKMHDEVLSGGALANRRSPANWPPMTYRPIGPNSSQMQSLEASSHSRAATSTRSVSFGNTVSAVVPYQQPAAPEPEPSPIAVCKFIETRCRRCRRWQADIFAGLPSPRAASPPWRIPRV
jgi:hypothetical protein